MKVNISLSAGGIKRTAGRVAAAMKRMPKMAKTLEDLESKIRTVRMKALIVYLKHKKEQQSKLDLDFSKVKPKGQAPKKTTVDLDLDFTKPQASMSKVDPVVARRNRQIVAALRMKENKPLRAKLKALKAKRDAIKDKIWNSYVAKLKAVRASRAVKAQPKKAQKKGVKK